MKDVRLSGSPEDLCRGHGPVVGLCGAVELLRHLISTPLRWGDGPFVPTCTLSIQPASDNPMDQLNNKITSLYSYTDLSIHDNIRGIFPACKAVTQKPTCIEGDNFWSAEVEVFHGKKVFIPVEQRDITNYFLLQTSFIYYKDQVVLLWSLCCRCYAVLGKLQRIEKPQLSPKHIQTILLFSSLQGRKINK